MKTFAVFLGIFLLSTLLSYGQKDPNYQVFALKFNYVGKRLAKSGIQRANPTDSVSVCHMFWFLKGENGHNIIVDAGFLDTMNTNKNYVRPDKVLERLDVDPSDIADIILTHPHYDHIGGINLFPKARVWIQEVDYDFFTGEAWQSETTPVGYQKNDVRNLIEINLQGRLKLIKGDNIEIIPGIKVFAGSTHTPGNQYLLVNANSQNNKIIIASDAIWFYYNFENMLPATLCIDAEAYVEAMKRMKTMVDNPDLIIPGHDDLVFSKFPTVKDGIVRISN
jgi:glyoxylase-like metal-dependent hydrolase (beta-lactamase superfamily II)